MLMTLKDKATAVNLRKTYITRKKGEKGYRQKFIYTTIYRQLKCPRGQKVTVPLGALVVKLLLQIRSEVMNEERTLFR